MAGTKEKTGANGRYAVVTLAHELFATGPEPVLTESQTYLLLGPQPSSPAKMSVPVAPDELPPLTKWVTPDDTLLFQYSALGFNSHRIHLDRDYARKAEGFPDIVVNGGLATLLLTEYLRTELGISPRSLTARHIAPLFCGRPLLLGAEQRGDAWLLQAFDETQRLALEIVAEST